MNYPLKVVVIKAHPDEAEVYAGGTCARLADRGAAIKFVSLTNGDAGHYAVGRKALRRRRAGEAYAAARHIGVQDYEIHNTHDGMLTPTPRLREVVIASIRRWQADVVIAFHDEFPGHADNRASGRIVREAIDFLTNPNVVPDVPALAQQPVCLQMVDAWCLDGHRHDVVIAIDEVIERKLLACHEHASQFYEFAPFERGFEDRVPTTGAWADQRQYLLENWADFMYASDVMGADPDCTYAESYQLATYGRQLAAKDVQQMLNTARPMRV